MNLNALRRIEAIFNTYCFGHHFHLNDLRTGETFECGESRRYPIGSCFKLAVLGALFEELEESPSDLHRRFDVFQNSDYRGASILAPLSGPTHMSWLDLAQLMISISDGWATDLIIDRVGLKKVNEVLLRSAPESQLPLNLNDMVSRVEEIPEISRTKQRDWTPNQASAFLCEISELGFTNAQDLATLAKSAYPPRFSSTELNIAYEETIRIKRYVPRTEMFYDAGICCLSKTGSLIKRYFMNDCGVFVDPRTSSPIACFGYCSHGWRLPVLTCDCIGGLIGLDIARALGLNPVQNADWSVEFEKMFLAGID